MKGMKETLNHCMHNADIERSKEFLILSELVQHSLQGMLIPDEIITNIDNTL